MPRRGRRRLRPHPVWRVQAREAPASSVAPRGLAVRQAVRLRTARRRAQARRNLRRRRRPCLRLPTMRRLRRRSGPQQPAGSAPVPVTTQGPMKPGAEVLGWPWTGTGLSGLSLRRWPGWHPFPGPRPHPHRPSDSLRQYRRRSVTTRLKTRQRMCLKTHLTPMVSLRRKRTGSSHRWSSWGLLQRTGWKGSLGCQGRRRWWNHRPYPAWRAQGRLVLPAAKEFPQNQFRLELRVEGPALATQGRKSRGV